MAGQALGADDLVGRFGVRPIYRILMERWLRRLAAHGVLREQDGLYVADSPLPEPQPEAVADSVRGAFTDASVLLRWVETSGPILDRILTGEESPLDVVFSGGSSDLADELYHAARRCRATSTGLSVPWRRPSRPARRRDAACGSSRSGRARAGRRASILPALPAGRVEYHFTDLSDFFLARVEQQFREFPFVSYGLLDLERDPREQGYAAGQYDMVVAANVLHATRDLGRTVDSVRSLLAPDGLLLLYEVTDPPSYFDTTVALIEGWQIFSDALRVDSPLLNTPQWLDVLRTRRFAEVVAFPAAGSPAEVMGAHVFVARAPGGAVDAGRHPARSVAGRGALAVATMATGRDRRRCPAAACRDATQRARRSSGGVREAPGGPGASQGGGGYHRSRSAAVRLGPRLAHGRRAAHLPG